MGPVKGLHGAQEVRGKQIPGFRSTFGKRGDVSQKLLLSLFVVSLVLFVICLKACFVPSPGEQIRRLIQTASNVVEKHHFQKSLSYVSPDYKDDVGFDYQTLAYTVKEVFRSYPKLSVSSKIRTLSVQKDQVEVDLTAEVLGTLPSQDPEDLLAWRKSHRFLVTFKKIQKEWKVVSTKKPDEKE